LIVVVDVLVVLWALFDYKINQSSTYHRQVLSYKNCCSDQEEIISSYNKYYNISQLI